MPNAPRAPRWMSRVLLAAAVSPLLWGGGAVLAPARLAAWMGREPPRDPVPWQCLGIVVGVYGVGYALAARAPYRHGALVLVGLLAKVLVPIGFVGAALQGRVPWDPGWVLVAHDLIWCVPLALILRGASRAHRLRTAPPVLPVGLALSLYRDRDGVDLLEASGHRLQHLVFLRHFGCTFCREALADLSAVDERLQATGARLVLVHMSPEHEAQRMFDKHGLDNVTAISDPDRVLYRAFALRRGRPSQLFGWTVLKRGWEAGVRRGHGIGWVLDDAPAGAVQPIRTWTSLTSVTVASRIVPGKGWLSVSVACT